MGWLALIPLLLLAFSPSRLPSCDGKPRRRLTFFEFAVNPPTPLQSCAHKLDLGVFNRSWVWGLLASSPSVPTRMVCCWQLRRKRARRINLADPK